MGWNAAGRPAAGSGMGGGEDSDARNGHVATRMAGHEQRCAVRVKQVAAAQESREAAGLLPLKNETCATIILCALVRFWCYPDLPSDSRRKEGKKKVVFPSYAFGGDKKEMLMVIDSHRKSEAMLHNVTQEMLHVQVNSIALLHNRHLLLDKGSGRSRNVCRTFPFTSFTLDENCQFKGRNAVTSTFRRRPSSPGPGYRVAHNVASPSSQTVPVNST